MNRFLLCISFFSCIILAQSACVVQYEPEYASTKINKVILQFDRNLVDVRATPLFNSSINGVKVRVGYLGLSQLDFFSSTVSLADTTATVSIGRRSTQTFEESGASSLTTDLLLPLAIASLPIQNQFRWAAIGLAGMMTLRGACAQDNCQNPYVMVDVYYNNSVILCLNTACTTYTRQNTPTLASCSDGIKNALETDIDCGGLNCTKCATGKNCTANGDCLTSYCNLNTCSIATVSCVDGLKNGNEADIDCGGSCPNKCATGKNCTANGDCQTGYCNPSTLRCDTAVTIASCTDGVKNGNEADVDCGGSCPNKCATGKNCTANGDCQTNYCNLNTFLCDAIITTCTNGVKDGDESDVDCGRNCPTKCGLDKNCLATVDCVNGTICPNYKNATYNFKCAPLDGCFNGVIDNTESDTDCGGNCTARCSAGQYCRVNSDCAGETYVCNANLQSSYYGTCQLTGSCFDGVKNGAETGIDCGVTACNRGCNCTTNAECAEGDVCSANTNPTYFQTCVSQTSCFNGIKEGLETDVDCGGNCQLKCTVGKGCAATLDCADGTACNLRPSAAFYQTCRVSPGCYDGIQNQGETDIDCGSVACQSRCSQGQGCSVEDDCPVTDDCINNFCLLP